MDFRKDYHIVHEINLNHCEHQPYPWLFGQLQPWRESVFRPQDRIVLTYSGTVTIDLLSHVQRVIKLLDITNLFFLIATTDVDIKSKIDQVHADISADQTSFDFCIVPLEQYNTGHPITNFSLPHTVCLAAWGRLDIKTDGTVAPCCAYRGRAMNDNGVKMNITKHSIKEIYFAKNLVNLRQDLLAGKKPSECNRCWENETAQIKSIRQHHAWDLYDQQYNIDFYKDTLENVKIIHSELGNVCNLKCRICMPECSSKIAAEEIAQLSKDKQKTSGFYHLQQNKSWVKNKNIKFWQEYLIFVPNLIEIGFTGGEPMLIDQQFELVEKIANNANASNIHLRYVTNGTVFPGAHTIDTWEQYKKISITVSVDDIGKRFEYQRSGAKWLTVKKNLQQYQLLKQQINMLVSINCTVSIFNIWYLPEICHEIEQLNIDHVRLSVLQFPEVLCIKNLSFDVKLAISKKLSNAVCSQLMRSQIEPIINFLNLPSDPDTTHDISNHIRRLDQIRNQNFDQIFPEMAKLLNYQK